MGRLNKVIDLVLFYSLGAALTLLVIVCFAQVIARYVLSASFAWAEEVSICLMMWAAWVGSSIAVKQGSHLRILLFVDRWTERTKLIVQVVINGLAVLFLGFVAYTSKAIIDGMSNATFFSLPWVPMNTMYISVPAGCVVMIYYMLRSIIGDWKSLLSGPGKGG
jgi:TRAP-type C4-dicarboxylate transport system permease small subunit